MTGIYYDLVEVLCLCRFIFPVGLWVSVNSNMLKVLEATGLSVSASCDVLLTSATVVACDPFFLQVEVLLLEDLLMDFQLSGSIDQTFGGNGKQQYPRNDSNRQT